MNVKIVSHTQPTPALKRAGIKTAEDLIVYCARVSNPNNQLNKETGPKLIQYLIKHKHWSPFEMVDLCLEVKTSRAIAAQILRHRSFSFQEFSQRYSEVTELEPIEWRMQGKTNRQVGDQAANIDKECLGAINDLMATSLQIYEILVGQGVAKESARMILPLTTQTTLYMKGSIRSWIHYLEVRCDENTQKEHRDIANAAKDIIKDLFPNLAKGLLWK